MLPSSLLSGVVDEEFWVNLKKDPTVKTYYNFFFVKKKRKICKPSTRGWPTHMLPIHKGRHSFSGHWPLSQTNIFEKSKHTNCAVLWLNSTLLIYITLILSMLCIFLPRCIVYISFILLFFLCLVVFSSYLKESCCCNKKHFPEGINNGILIVILFLLSFITHLFLFCTTLRAILWSNLPE